MTIPTPAETNVFLEKLRAQASFLQDPAILDAVSFIERMIGTAEDQDFGHSRPSQPEIRTPSNALKKAA